MKILATALSLGLIFGIQSLSFAQSETEKNLETYNLLYNSEGNLGINFKIGFTFGTHDGLVEKAAGEIKVRKGLNHQIELISANYVVPIDRIRTGNKLRDCHLRQAMGVKYEGSTYPKQDNCKNNQLPTTGPDSVAFPTITFKSTGSKVLSMELNEDAMPEYQVAITGVWNIHGVDQVITAQNPMILKVKENLVGYQVQTSHKFLLSDFGVQVRKVSVGPISVTVKNEATLNLNMKMGYPSYGNPE